MVWDDVVSGMVSAILREINSSEYYKLRNEHEMTMDLSVFP